MILWLLAWMLLPSSGARIAGVVITDDTDRKPVRHALVTVSGPSKATMVTGDDGTFAFPDLAGGTYRLTAAKPGYPTSEFGVRPGRDVGTAIALAPSQQLTMLKILVGRGAVITGRLTGESGEPVVGVSVEASTIRLPPIGTSDSFVPLGLAVSDDDGVYRIYGLPEGDYVVTAIPTVAKDSTVAYTATSYPGVTDPAEATIIPVSSGEEHGGADITMRAAQARVFGTGADDRPRASVRGRVVIDGASSSAAPALPIAVMNTVPFPVGRGGIGTSSADGTWGFDDLAPGRYTVVGTVADSDVPRQDSWVMRSATLDGRDVMNSPFEVGATTVSGITVVFTDKAGTARGALTTSAGAPATDFLVVVFSADRNLWQAKPREARIIAPDTDGNWSTSAMLPGDYRVAAIADWTSRSRVTPALLEQLMAASAPISIAVGQTTTINLRVGG